MADYLGSITRHLDDLRTRTYEGFAGRDEREEHFARVVAWLDPVVREYLEIADAKLLDGTGTIVASDGVERHESGSTWAYWTLSWPEIEALGIEPARIAAPFFVNWQHPHLHGAFPGPVAPAPELACTNVWPLQVKDPSDIEERRPVIEAIVETELHAKVCTQAFALRGAGRDANQAWREFPSYRRLHDNE